MKPAAPLLLCLALAACATTTRQARPARTASLLNQDELALEVSPSTPLLDAIQRLRPDWMRSRGAMGTMHGGEPSGYQVAGPPVGLPPAVAVNQAVFPDPGVLASIPSGSVLAARLLTRTEATTRYGPEMINGLIEVTTRSGR